MNYELLLGLGMLVGFLGGYAGIGGAPIMIAVLTLFFGLDQHLAQGSVLAVMLGPMTMMGVIALREKVGGLLKYALIAILAYATFSYLGGYLAFRVSDSSLKSYFSLFLIFLGAHEFLKLKIISYKTEINCFNIAILGCIIGVAGGFWGVGAGVLMIPIFINIFDMDKDDARCLSLLILLPPVSIGAVVKYQSESAIVWYAVLILFIGYFITNFFGAKLALGHSHSFFRKFYGCMLISMGGMSLLI